VKRFPLRNTPARAFAPVSLRVALGCSLALACCTAPAQDVTVHADWDKPLLTSKTTATLQVVVNPLIERKSPIHDEVFRNLKQLGADDVRYVPWLPYPKLAVAELEPPTASGTSWDFHLIDPMTEDFLNATEGHDCILNFSTAPAWLFKTEKPVTYPSDPDQAYWHYTQGTELVDPTGGQLGAYYDRLIDWYTNGGFTDENGQRHDSGHHYKIAWWEVGNEVDIEHDQTPEQYTQRYDAIVSAVHKDNPQMKFVGLALAFPSTHPQMFEYFLNHANHKPGIPLNMISYHFYATPQREETVDNWQYSFFNQADRFLATVDYIEAIRKRLSPETKTTLDEIGSILPTDSDSDNPNNPGPPISPYYWRLSGALYSYVYIESVKMGIDVVGESQLVGYPSQYPSVSMVDWNTGKPNARFATLKLLKDNFSPGDSVMETTATSGNIDALAFVQEGTKKLLLVNKRDRSIRVDLPAGFEAASLSQVITADGASIPATEKWQGKSIELDPFAVAVLSTR
jgi:hypothetical protein